MYAFVSKGKSLHHNKLNRTCDYREKEELKATDTA